MKSKKSLELATEAPALGGGVEKRQIALPLGRGGHQLIKNEGPFSQDVLNRIFAISPKHPDRLISRESGWLEFKEAFGFRSLGKYIRSAAAFANAKGGYIVYGVANRPHKLIGLKDRSFDDLDPAKLTQFFNEHFDPEIEWGRHLYELNGKVFGI